MEHGYFRTTLDVDLVVPDVIELIKELHRSRDLAVDEPVRPLYLKTWDAPASEK